jgi:hypothetical protein
MRIDPTCRSIIQQKRYLVDLQVGPILIFVRGCKRPGLQPGCNKFFSKYQICPPGHTPSLPTSPPSDRRSLALALAVSLHSSPSPSPPRRPEHRACTARPQAHSKHQTSQHDGAPGAARACSRPRGLPAAPSAAAAAAAAAAARGRRLGGVLRAVRRGVVPARRRRRRRRRRQRDRGRAQRQRRRARHQVHRRRDHRREGT